MTIHENQALFSDAVIAAAQRFHIREIYVEKDYWVTLALWKIFSSPIAADAVFKGGTALSKCHRLIGRFSEDIDMVVLKREGDSSNRLAGKLKAIYNAINTELPEVELEGITNKKGMIRKTAHEFPKLGFTGVYGQVRQQIILESTWLGRPEPYERKTVHSYIGEMMESTGREDLQDQYNMHPFYVQVLTVERTLCEKIMSLVRFSFTEHPYTDLSNKIRHVYDLNRMLTNKKIKAFLEGTEFESMLNMVGQDDITSFKNNNQWLANHPATAIVFNQSEGTWQEIKGAYQANFRDLVTGKLPAEEELMETLIMIGKRLQEIKWALKLRG